MLPERFSKEPATYGAAKGRVIDNDAALDGYYKACNYDPELAIPTMEKFEELGLGEIGKRVYANV